MPYTKTFKELLKSTKETYLGKPLRRRDKKKYGKKYDLNETKQIAFAIAKSKGIKIDIK